MSLWTTEKAVEPSKSVKRGIWWATCCLPIQGHDELKPYQKAWQRLRLPRGTAVCWYHQRYRRQCKNASKCQSRWSSWIDRKKEKGGETSAVSWHKDAWFNLDAQTPLWLAAVFGNWQPSPRALLNSNMTTHPPFNDSSKAFQSTNYITCSKFKEFEVDDVNEQKGMTNPLVLEHHRNQRIPPVMSDLRVVVHMYILE